MKDFKTMLDDYAKLCVEVGINIQKDQPLVVNAPIEAIDFVRLIAKHAYRAGAKYVHVNWSDEVLTRLKYENAPMEVFENFPDWNRDMLVDLAKDGAGFLSISASNPELLKGIEPEKISAANKASSTALTDYMSMLMNDFNSWCVMSIPTGSWAKKVFPDLDEDQAIEKLWQKIFFATRMDREDPLKAWQDHLKLLEDKLNFLNSQNFKFLHYKSENGTDLKVELPEGHIWAGGGSHNKDNTFFVANMPTEEVFTMPKRDGVNGLVYSTKPLNYSGSLISDFWLEFKDGQVVDFKAKEGQDVLEKLINFDEGARRLGEVALVPHKSPISDLNIIFYNTLFDENASCHFAFGKAYPTNIKGGETMSPEELKAHGVNDSLTHVDFMVGSEDLSIIGEKEDGEKIEIFKDGNWA